jgi:hypothetical protein
LKKKENKHEAKIIKKAFGKPEKMDEEDAWLRNFILKKGWKDENDLQYIDDIVDMEDEMKDEEVTDAPLVAIFADYSSLISLRRELTSVMSQEVQTTRRM